MSRIRHIAIIVPDAEEAAKFYEQALGLKRAGTARRGIYLSDGVINVALLTREHADEKLGLYHFGVWVDDLDAAEKQVVDAGGTYLAGRPTSPNSFYEAKYRDPNGVVFDLAHHGWAGAAKDRGRQNVSRRPSIFLKILNHGARIAAIFPSPRWIPGGERWKAAASPRVAGCEKTRFCES